MSGAYYLELRNAWTYARLKSGRLGPPYARTPIKRITMPTKITKLLEELHERAVTDRHWLLAAATGAALVDETNPDHQLNAIEKTLLKRGNR